MRMFTIAALFCCVATTVSAKDITGKVWVLSVDKPGSLTTDSTTIENGDTISYATFAPTKDATVDGQVVCTAGTKYDAWILNQTKKDGTIVTQTFMVWDSKNDGELWDMGEAKISVVSAVDSEGNSTPLVHLKTGLRGNLLLGGSGANRGVTVSLGKTFAQANNSPTCVFRFSVKAPE